MVSRSAEIKEKQETAIQERKTKFIMMLGSFLEK